MALNASFRDFLAIKEDFGTGFAVDYNGKTMTSNSGLTFSTTQEDTWNTSYGVRADDNG